MGEKCGCKKTCYSDKTLVGNWVNNRSKFTKNKDVGDMYTTTIMRDYAPKQIPESHQKFVWDEKLKQQGTNMISNMSLYENRPNYYENYSTSYDLSYNHFPKAYTGSIVRKLRFRCMDHLPTDEYLKSYGNITTYGLQENLKYFWKRDKQEIKMTNITEYKEVYEPYNPDYYKNSIKVRKEVESISKENKSQCNPITWECKPDKYLCV